MTDIVIAAAPADEARADAIAEALAALGFDVAPRALDDADLTKVVDDAKCVLALWSPAASAEPRLAEQATLAMERNKLVCAELDDGAMPEPFDAAPRTNLDASDRIIFRERFEALIAQIEKLTPTEGDCRRVAASAGESARRARYRRHRRRCRQSRIVALATAEPLPPTSTQAPSACRGQRRQWWRMAGTDGDDAASFRRRHRRQPRDHRFRTAPMLARAPCTPRRDADGSAEADLWPYRSATRSAALARGRRPHQCGANRRRSNRRRARRRFRANAGVPWPSRRAPRTSCRARPRPAPIAIRPRRRIIAPVFI